MSFTSKKGAENIYTGLDSSAPDTTVFHKPHISCDSTQLVISHDVHDDFIMEPKLACIHVLWTKDRKKPTNTSDR